ncbi:MAG: hypothetical protein GX896_03195 [Clostridiales bacterium]|nr:hypothetical protein [Clostridiales bacterium]
MAVTIKLNKQAIAMLEEAVNNSAKSAMDEVLADLKSSGTMPFDVGNMQNSETFVVSNENGASLVTGSPQAKRLYYHPEYNFQKDKNGNAGAKWFEPYIDGDKMNLAQEEFEKEFKKRSGV